MGVDIQAGLAQRKIDVHHHVGIGPSGLTRSDSLVAAADMLGIRELWCSRPIGNRMGSMDEVKASNDAVLAAMARHPQHIRGLCFIIPGYSRAALAEVERCLSAGMIGIKLYNQYKICDPVVWPLIELAMDKNIPILEHAAYLGNPEGKARQPLTSHGADFAAVSKRFPKALLINAHVAGGGDWEWTLRALRDASPNVYVDISGSNLDRGMVEMIVSELGHERVLFATDTTMEGSVGRLIGAHLPPEQKEMIWWGNATRILAAQGLQPLPGASATTSEGGGIA